MDARPVGVFDSGVGGLSVLAEIRRQCPNEDTMYYADTAHWPYGPRPADEVRGLAVAAVEQLLAGGAKVIVVACNSATTNGIAYLRQQFAVPFIGIEPAVKPAVARTKTRRIGVLATPATLGAASYHDLVARVAGDVIVVPAVVPDLVTAVEAGELNADQLQPMLRGVIGPLVAGGVDTLVLGCTHFPFARPAIEAAAGSRVAVIDSGEAVVRQLRRVLAEHGLENAAEHAGVARFGCSGDYPTFMNVVARLLPELFEAWADERLRSHVRGA